MLVLAIDTSSNVASIALVTESGLVSEHRFRHKMDLLRRLMPNVDKLVSDTGKSKTDIEGVVISLGPGSFTGLRIGMAAAKSIAHVLEVPIAGIPTLDVLAYGALGACPKAIVAAIHARPGEVFWALYRCDDGKLEKVVEDKVSTVEEVIERAKEELEPVFCGDGAERNREVFEVQFGQHTVLPDWFNSPRAEVLAALGINRLSTGDSDDLFRLEPHYIRKPTPVVRLEKSDKSSVK